MSTLEGPAGRATSCATPDTPDAAETLCHWLIDAPGQSPSWDQYVMFCVRLRDNIPGFPPPIRHFEGATHEVDVWAINPAHHLTAELIEGLWRSGGSIGHALLTPINVCVQFQATDDEMLQLVALAARAVVDGVLPAEPPLSGNPRGVWLQPLVKTLAHIRGEDHAP
jgi:hypothetical protein